MRSATARARKPAAQPAASMIAAAPDLLDPFAPSYDAEYGWPEDRPTSGIEVVPPIDWQPGDPTEASATTVALLEKSIEMACAARGKEAPPAATLAIVPKRSLIDRLEDTQAIYDTLAGLDADCIDDEARAELTAMLVESVSGTKAKIDSSCWVLAQYESSIALALAEATRCRERAERMDRQKANLESYLLKAITRSGGQTLEGHSSSISKRLNPAKLIIDDAGSIPIGFWRTPPPPPPPDAVLDNAAIKAALKLDPLAVAGCRLVQGEKLVRS